MGQLQLHFLFAAVVLTLTTGCHHSSQPTEATLTPTPSVISELPATDSVATGVVLAHHLSNRLPGLDYALYVPTIFSDTAHLAVIIFFDPHGDGQIPVGKYAALAEQKHCLLMGSNTSHNGMTLPEGMQIADALISEATETYHVNPNAITLCGFSGGAKVALVAGAANASVNYVVYCGAVQQWATLAHPIALLGFAGERDMNYTDLLRFSTTPQVQALPHYLMTWKGGHEWPDSSVFQYAFTHPFSTIPPVLLLHPNRAAWTALDREDAMKQTYITAFSTKDLAWWKAEIDNLNKTKTGNLMQERLLGYISLACYSLGHQTLQQNNLPAAEKILSIYRMADPENQDMEQMWAEYRQKAGG